MLLVGSMISVGQNVPTEDSIRLTFALDGKPVSCSNKGVELSVGERQFVPTLTSTGFIVPREFDDFYASETTRRQNNVSVVVTCNEYRLKFSGLYPARVKPGDWEVGIAYPPYWTERFRWDTELEKGTWVSYLQSECIGCDPGLITLISHPDPPSELVTGLRKEQTRVSGARARNIAYALAVFGSDYKTNRDYLLKLMGACLARPKESSEDDVCDSTLLDYLTNLYWRGDATLLNPLLQMADSRRDVIIDIGTFYADLLDRSPVAMLQQLGTLSVDQQEKVCQLAEDDLRGGTPKLTRVKANLAREGNETTKRCWSVIAR